MYNNFFYLLFFARNIEIIWGKGDKGNIYFQFDTRAKGGTKEVSEINQNTLGDYSVY